MKTDVATDVHPKPEAGTAASVARPLPVIGWSVWLAWGLAALALVSVFTLWQKLSGMQEQLARQSQESGKHAIEARTLARQAETEARDAVARLAAVDGRVNDLLAYRAQVEALVQAVVRGRDENLAVELEAGLRLAQDQAQITGQVEPLLATLRSAERRLSSSTDPRMEPVRRAVADDLERLRHVSAPDTAGLLARIEQLLAQVDDLPLGNSVGAQLRTTQQAQEDVPDLADMPWWTRWHQAVLAETHKLLRVSRMDHPEVVMLSPEQAFFVRENLKLRLQAARLALLARQHDAARADLALADQMLRQWFEPRSRRTRNAMDLLQRVQSESRAVTLPRVDGTLLALEQVAATATY